MATVREFDGAGDRIVFSPGVLQVVGGETPVTVMALVKLGIDGWRTIVSFEAPDADERVGIQVSPGDGVLALFTPFGSELVTDGDVAPPDEWLLVGMQRDGGENQMIRVHVQHADGTWLHTDTAARSDPGAIGPSGRIQVGEMSTFGEYFPGRLAVVGVWLDTFSDQELEGAGLHAALVNWLGLGSGPASLLRFNQESTNDPVEDVVAGSGVTQTSIVGTTAVEDNDLDFDYSLGGEDEATPHDAAHGHTAGAPALAQVHTLVPDDTSHSHTADAAALAQVHGLPPDDTSHSHTADAAALAQVHGLTAGDTAHGHSAGEPTLAQAHVLAAEDAAHGHATNEPQLDGTGIIAPADAAHGHTAGAPALAQLHLLPADDAAHGHVAGQPAVPPPGGPVAAITASVTVRSTAGQVSTRPTSEVVTVR